MRVLPFVPCSPGVVPSGPGPGIVCIGTCCYKSEVCPGRIEGTGLVVGSRGGGGSHLLEGGFRGISSRGNISFDTEL